VFEYCKDGKAGHVSTKLYKRLQGIQNGELDDKFGWNTLIE
jgi:branched-chain amino acid aminotransferase